MLTPNYPLLPTQKNGCPFLILAPMEGVGDQAFRKAMASIGGFDEAVRDFLRVPSNAHLPSLAATYQAEEISPFPLAAQLMGSDLHLMAEMTHLMELKGSKRVDLNCGCPSNTVTGKGAGSSLLKDPEFLYQVASHMVKATSIPVTAKLRSGFTDTSLFKENLLAVQASGIHYLTLHPRTKVEGYGPPANWNLIKEATALLSIPVVGNGDILTVNDALTMLNLTGCKALMIGRGSIINPFIFHEIKAHFSGEKYQPQWENLLTYFNVYLQELSKNLSEKGQVNKLKQLLGFFYKGHPNLTIKRQKMLQLNPATAQELLSFALAELKETWLFS